ncbi:DHHC palmitoyltransferase-domain-containing protein [Pisolithus tinctorius]|nr:DHHC palmitoyltransferase-domain-containing protein [Pisolithus tinctorius]
MATSQTSLSFTSSSSPAAPAKLRPPQLPLPSSNFGAVPVQRLQDSGATLKRSKSVGANRGRGSGSSIHGRSSTSIASHHNQGSTSLHIRDLPLSSPPTITVFQVPPIPSTTHAGGILPSAPFFRPSRPIHSRPSSPSVTSHEALPASNPTVPEQYPLASLRRPSSHDSDLASADISGSLKGLDHFTKRLKHSREPLLPISHRSHSRSINIPSRSPTNDPSSQWNSTGIRVRTSVERIFRGFSFDSFRNKSNSSPHTSRFSSTEHSHAPGGEYSTTYLPQKSLTHPLAEISSSGPSSYSPSPNQIFIAEPPKSIPPLSAVPVRPLKRNYQQHPSRNRFFCGGRLITGGDSPWAFVASLTVVCVISGVWFGNTCVWWWRNESPAVAAVGAYMCLLTVSTMLTTAFRDPGILPRNLDPDPPLPAVSPSDGGVRIPLPRDLKVRNDFVRVKYCSSCKTYRPPRSSHCKMCDNCVDGCDHHCQWVNNCIGRRNYTFFFAFLCSAVLTLCLVICTSAIHLYLLTRRNHENLRHAVVDGIGSAIAFSLSIIVIWPVTALLAYHMRLLFLNITTIEQIRNQAHKSLEPGVRPTNPFSYGSWRSNLAEVLCRPAGLSWLDARGYLTEDKRRINPGLDDVGLGWDDAEGNGQRTTEE